MVQPAIEERETNDRSASRHLLLRPGESWNAVKVFSAEVRDGENPVGAVATDWLACTGVSPIEIVVAQSSTGHDGCVSIGIFYREPVE